MSQLRGGAWFITGTDTAVGKTTIAIGLLRAAHQRGLTTAGLKPVAAGVDANGQNADAAELQLAASINLDYANINPALLKQAIAPHIAAADEGVTLGVAELAAQLEPGLEAGVDFTVVEGAGGWLVPLNEPLVQGSLVSESRTEPKPPRVSRPPMPMPTSPLPVVLSSGRNVLQPGANRQTRV